MYFVVLSKLEIITYAHGGAIEMGLWWKKVKALPVKIGGFEIPGDPEALPKDYFAFWQALAPWSWRSQWKWCLFSVVTGEPWCRVYFDDGTTQMQFRRRIFTSKFAVRIGPTSTRFLAVGTDGKPIELLLSQKRYTYAQIMAAYIASRAPMRNDHSNITLL